MGGRSGRPSFFELAIGTGYGVVMLHGPVAVTMIRLGGDSGTVPG